MRKFSSFLVLIFLLFSLMSFSGCYSNRIIHSDGYFKYIIRRDGNVGLVGLTASGQEQEIIILPHSIKGRKVTSFYDESILTIYDNITMYDWESENLKKVIIPFEVKSIYSPFTECKKLVKTVFIPLYFNISVRGGAGQDEFRRNLSRIYLAETTYEDWERGYLSANVAYMWNFDGDEVFNKGYYWLDDEEYGSLITLTAPVPTRKGYTFAGWYKEPECVNIWNFDNDMIPEEILEEHINYYGIKRLYPKLQRTSLFAKWVKK